MVGKYWDQKHRTYRGLTSKTNPKSSTHQRDNPRCWLELPLIVYINTSWRKCLPLQHVSVHWQPRRIQLSLAPSTCSSYVFKICQKHSAFRGRKKPIIANGDLFTDSSTFAFYELECFEWSLFFHVKLLCLTPPALLSFSYNLAQMKTHNEKENMLKAWLKAE